MSYLFVYGTLKKKELADRVLQRDLPEHPVELDGYEKMHVPGKEKDEFTIVENPLGEVSGDLIEVNSKELTLCDHWESTYDRRKISEYNGEAVFAYFYGG